MSIQKIQPYFKINEEKLRQLRLIAPEVFKDGVIDFHSLYEEFSDYIAEEVDLGDEPYGIYWPGKQNAKRNVQIQPLDAIIPVFDKNVNSELTRNILIEGENLKCLKLIKKAYGGQIKLIYIDPPYNTGTDLIYEDDFTETNKDYLERTGQIDNEGKILTTNLKSNGRFHSNWLSMMYPRLKLSYELLKDDGFILVHIDENEVNNITLVLNEIYGEENNVGQIIWDKRNPKGDARGIAYQHEYILCYIKNKDYLISKDTIQRPKKNAPQILTKASELFKKLGVKDIPDDLKQLVKKYNIRVQNTEEIEKEFTLETINKEFAEWIRKQDFSGGEKAYNKIDLNGDVYQTVSMAWPNKKRAPDEYFIPLVHPSTGNECPVPEKGWRFPPKTMKELLDKNLIIFGPDQTTQPRSKYLLKENLKENIPSVIPFGGSDEKLFSKWKLPFENPKPFRFSAELIKYFVSDGDIVLDFFAGSGTTGHAIYELISNEKDIRFVLIQLPEIIKEKSSAYKAGFRYITEITIKRLNLASNEYKKDINTGFKFFVLANSSFKNWHNYSGSDIGQLETLFNQHEEPLVENWDPECLLTEILLLEGFPLDSMVEVIESFNKNIVKKITSEFCEHALFVCLDMKVEEETIKAISFEDNDIFICLDNAITDQDKVRLADKGLIKTI